MEEIKFMARIRNIGNSCVITIPKDFLDAKLLEENQSYWFQVLEKIKIIEDKNENE